MNLSQKLWTSHWSGGLWIGCLAWLLTVYTLDPVGNYPNSWQGPGITLDESFNVQQGVLLVEAWNAYGVFLIDPVNVREFFGGESGIPYLPDHPPLGRLMLGMAHHLCQAFFPPEQILVQPMIACARAGSATMFAATVFLIGWAAGCWYGCSAGWFAALAVLLMPRLFGHAHLAALESAVNLTYVAAILGLAHSWGKTRTVFSGQSSISSPIPSSTPTAVETTPAEPPVAETTVAEIDMATKPDSLELPPLTWKWAFVPGCLLGLALLTKIQGFLLIPSLIGWGLWYWRGRAILPLLVLGLVGGGLFFLCWPWLWLDPVGHLQQFLGSATDRASLQVWYWGTAYADTEVPWHYPWVMFAVTVPLGLHLLGMLGAAQVGSQCSSDPRSVLVLLGILFPLLLFSTSVAVYDGVRLFLVVFPLWGLMIGLGGQMVWEWLREGHSRRLSWGLCACFWLLQGWGLYSTHPCQLSYYNLLTSGLQGANAIGLEPTYWGDSLTRSFWKECGSKIPAGALLEVAPVLHQFQLKDLENQSPLIQERQWKLQPLPLDQLDQLNQEKATGQSGNTSPRYWMIFYRKASLPEWLREQPSWSPRTGTFEISAALQERGLTPLAILQRKGVALAALFEVKR